jgi:hypothetical protein
MKTWLCILVCAALSAGCRIHQNSALVITKVIPATATATGTAPNQTVACAFDLAAKEFTPGMNFNPFENQGTVAAVVTNNLVDTATINAQFNTNSSSFFPHQGVANFEYIPASAGTPPGEVSIPTGGGFVPAAGTGGVGLDLLAPVAGALAAIPDGTYVRVSFYVSGKLLDGSTVRTTEREYLFIKCSTPGCGFSSPFAVTLNAGTPQAVEASCF